jgi:hypothetical protein
MKAFNEKNELVKHLELIETDIIARERATHKNEIDQIMLEKVKLMAQEKEKNEAVLTNLNTNLEYIIYNYNNLSNQYQICDNEKVFFKHQLELKIEECNNKTCEIDTLKLNLLEVSKILNKWKKLPNLKKYLLKDTIKHNLRTDNQTKCSSKP